MTETKFKYNIITEHVLRRCLGRGVATSEEALIYAFKAAIKNASFFEIGQYPKTYKVITPTLVFVFAVRDHNAACVITVYYNQKTGGFIQRKLNKGYLGWASR